MTIYAVCSETELFGLYRSIQAAERLQARRGGEIQAIEWNPGTGHIFGLVGGKVRAAVKERLRNEYFGETKKRHYLT